MDELATTIGWNYGDLMDAVETVMPVDHPALVHGDAVTSWGELGARTNNIARNLIKIGAQTGDKVAFYLRNHPAYTEGVVACFKARLVHANVNYRYVAEEVRHILADSDASIVIFGREFSPIVERVHDTLPEVKLWLIVEDHSGVDVPDFARSYEDFAGEGRGVPLDIVRSPDDQLLLYTGGTTGLPKGVVWAQDSMRRTLLNPVLVPKIPSNLDEHVEIVKEAGRGPICLPACPLMHGTGLFTAISALIAGGTVVTLASTNLNFDELWDVVFRRNVEQIIIVGDAFAKPMLRALESRSEKGTPSSVQVILSSGVMWSMEVKQEILRYLPMATLLDSFGSSEGMGLGLSVTTAAGAAGTGKFSIGENVKVFTEDGREILPGSGEVGLIARGEPIPLGYYKDPVKTAATFRTIDGARYSIPGDFCTVDLDGIITLLGRGSGCINTAGEKVFPEEVEEILKQYGDVEDALVIGLPDEKWGQLVMAVVELRYGAELDTASLRAFARQHLAGYKTPKKIVAVSKMFRAPNGKADYKSAKEFAIKAMGKPEDLE